MITKLKKMISNNYMWICFILCICVLMLISYGVIQKSIFEFDIKIYEFLLRSRNNILNLFFKGVTIFGNASTLIVFSILSIIFFKDKIYKLLVPLNLAGIGLLNDILKRSFCRERPNNLRLIEETGYSFPSGHAMASTAFYGILIYITVTNVKNIKIRNLICTLLLILILLIDISRVYIGVHYASDVIAGTCVSICHLILLIKFLNNKVENFKKL